MNRDLTIEALLGASFDCGCGKHHSTRFSRMIMKSGAIAELPGLLEELGKKRPHMVCDTHTWAVCGEKTKVVQFVERAYRECMGRAADAGGLKYWSKSLYEHTKTGKSLVNVTSREKDCLEIKNKKRLFIEQKR